MARGRRERVTVAELLVRSTAPHDRHRTEDARARHRQKPPVLHSLAKVRVLSVVAGALALTGGVATAVSMPADRSAGAVWPPSGLEPPVVTLVPSRADAVVPPAPPVPESVVPSRGSGGISPAVVDRGSNSGKSAGKFVKTVKATGPGKSAPRRVAPVRHEIPDVPAWSRSQPAGPDRQGARAGHRDGGHHHDRGGHGGGRHRR